MVLETERLQLVLLDAGQMALWAADMAALERELGCRYQGEPVKGIFRKIVEGQVKAAREDPGRDVWHCFWWLVRREDRVVVGTADFKSPPDAQGRVEIGYGLGSGWEHQGYMTEAVKAMCRWALEQPEVRQLIAETEREGVASQRVLQRCGFSLYDSGETLWWKRERLCVREGKEGWCCPAVFGAYGDCLYQPDWGKFCRVARELEGDDTVRLLRAERGGQVLGACAVRQHPEGRAEILGIGTAPGSRRQGVGRQMVASLQQDKGITVLEAETDGEAVDFYRRCGFAAEAHQKRYPNGVVTRYRCTWKRNEENPAGKSRR